jgi:hypothetical protein
MYGGLKALFMKSVIVEMCLFFAATVPLLEHLPACEDGGLGVERVEDGLDNQEVAPPVQQPPHLLGVRLHQLVERRVPNRGASHKKMSGLGICTSCSDVFPQGISGRGGNM